MNVATSKEILMALVASSIVCPGRDAHSLSFHPVPNCPFNFFQPSKVDRIAELGFEARPFGQTTILSN
ncbi:hypothetical protein K0M31_015873 [Melipona bicolor]|uniref:Uncharacterized protein n=1 Tax=Melipona bicolor TaxID=60889 RepID=A0AA40KSX5_9HYME|nr:hypothetical protein K0M31_015873 [Melipona bicolor]